MKVLIADDSSFMRTIIKNYLRSFDDISTEEAEDGDDTISKFKTFKPDLVLLDIIMPKKNGLVVLKEIKSINRLAVVVIVTSVGQTKMVEEAMRLGAKRYITKPFRYEDIASVVNDLR